MTWIEIVCVIFTFCLIYGFICFGLGILYAKRMDKRESNEN